jgi:hypothetical protein
MRAAQGYTLKFLIAMNLFQPQKMLQPLSYSVCTYDKDEEQIRLFAINVCQARITNCEKM